MVFFGAASLGTMNRYRSGMVQVMKLFGQAMWPVLVTTDVIVRSERWGRLREQIEASISMGAPVPGYSSAKPWDLVIAQSSYGRAGLNSDWWRSHFELPCTLASSAAGASKTIKDIEGQPASSGASSQHPQESKSRDRPRGQQKTETQKGAAGGTEVCRNWNNRTGRCAPDGKPCFRHMLHKCDICGGNHRAIDYHTGSGEAYAKGAKRWQPASGGGESKRKWSKH